MKTILAVSLVLVGLQQLDALLDSMNAWVELGLKVAGLAATMGASWRWAIGPGWRKVRGVFGWTEEQLRLIGTLDSRLDSLDERLDRGEVRFSKIDAALESLAAEEAKMIRHAIRTGDPVQFTEEGGVDRRDGDPATDRRS